MKLVVLSDDALLTELKAGITDGMIAWAQVKTVEEMKNHPDAGAYFDLLFEKDMNRIQILESLLPKPVFLNAVDHTSSDFHPGFIRINGWPTFLKRNVLEACCGDEITKTKAAAISAVLNKTIDWVPDVPGFISARVVSMIINEAYFALDEKVSSKQEIDTAMKLGTNYPYGPFEWAEKIGLQKIYALLNVLSKINSRYQPCSLLQKEATQ